jgi:RNA polymerase sigma-70 factor, ECF subfamily
MMVEDLVIAETPATLADEDIVRRVVAGEKPLFEILMRRYNQRLYRLTRAFLRDAAEAEEVMQETYVRAYANLSQFAERARFSTWLLTIATHACYSRLRKRGRWTQLGCSTEEEEHSSMPIPEERSAGPEEQAARLELRAILERAIHELPDAYRTVFVLRDVEEMSVADTAECLGLSEANVKIRSVRARALVRHWLYTEVGATATTAFTFMGEQCDRVVEAVFRRLARG